MKIKMTIDECLEYADEQSIGMSIYADSNGWRVVCMLLAEEVRKLRKHEYICNQCGIRKDSETEKAEF